MTGCSDDVLIVGGQPRALDSALDLIRVRRHETTRKLTYHRIETMNEAVAALTNEQRRYGIILAPFDAAAIKRIRRGGYAGVILLLGRVNPADAFKAGYDGVVQTLNSAVLDKLASAIRDVLVA
jgi:hypothetical protein